MSETEAPPSAATARAERAKSGSSLRSCALSPSQLDPAPSSRTALRFPVIDDRLKLGVADERALDAGRLAGIDWLVQHVAATKQFFRTARIEDDAAIHLRSNCERDA